MGEVGPDCIAGGATFTFYLHGDGTDESWTLAVGDSGEGSIALPAGYYDVWTPGGPIFNLTVPADGPTSFTYGFPRSVPAPAPAPEPEPEPAPVVETATLNVNTYECTGVSGGPIVLYAIGPDCTRIATNLDFYLWGDGTDDHWNLTTSAAGAVSIVLPVGDYDVLNTYTWERVGATVPSGGGTLSIGYAGAAPAPAPEPEPVVETATLNVNTYECTGVSGSPIILNEIGPDCTRIATNLDFYLWGDGTDDHWNLTTSAAVAVSNVLPVGDYEVLNTYTWERVGATVPSGGGTLFIGYAGEAPAPEPEPAPVAETGVLTVNTYECTGVTGGAIILNEIGPDCTRVSRDLDFYLWGDGTDDNWRVTTSAAGPVSVELFVGDYLVIDNPSWLRVDATVTEDGGTLNIGFPAP